MNKISALLLGVAPALAFAQLAHEADPTHYKLSAVELERSFPDRIVKTSHRTPQRIHLVETEGPLQTA